LATATALFAATPALGASGAAGTTPLLTSGSTALGPASGARTITLALTSGDPTGLRAFLADPAHPQLTPQQFTDRFGPSTAAVDAVRSWATSAGLTVDSVSANRLLVGVSGPATALGAALGVSFEQFRSASGTDYVASRGTATLPSSVAADVSAVLGLSDIGRVSGRPLHPSASSGISFPSSYGPKDFWSLYNAPAGQTGTGQTVSVIAEGDLTQPRKDLAQFESTFGLPAVTWNQINVGTPSSDTSGDDEWDLDTQYSTGFAPGVGQVNVYVGPSLSNADIATTVNRWVTDDISKQASFSAGECELLANLSGFSATLDAVLAQAQAQGQTLFTSSGDTGSQCPAVVAVNGVPAGLPGDNYPASSPGAIGVGGTTVLGSGPNEIAWYAGGGGSSLLEPTPAWQAAAGGSFLGVQRGVPDVSLDADPNSGYDVIVNGSEQVIGGTSASAPSWQGIWARAQGAHGGALGFGGPVIYGTEPASAFHDIVLGSNGLYPATPGWDYDTGRGTPDITGFVTGA
jgi:pseudomonalisin/xanthomonalisin